MEIKNRDSISGEKNILFLHCGKLILICVISCLIKSFALICLVNKCETFAKKELQKFCEQCENVANKNWIKVNEEKLLIMIK